MEMKKLQNTADLFEVSFPEYKQLRQCRSDIILVKNVWDMVIFVKVRLDLHTKFCYKDGKLSLCINNAKTFKLILHVHIIFRQTDLFISFKAQSL